MVIWVVDEWVGVLKAALNRIGCQVSYPNFSHHCLMTLQYF